jgi:hypothetical protein
VVILEAWISDYPKKRVFAQILLNFAQNIDKKKGTKV